MIWILKNLAKNTSHLSKLNDNVQQPWKEKESLVNKLLYPEKEALFFWKASRIELQNPAVVENS